MTYFLSAFVLSTVFWLAVFVYGLRRIAKNLHNNKPAQEAFLTTVLMPIFGDKELPMAEEEKS